MEEEKHTQKDPQNNNEKTTQTTPARTRTRNNNTNKNVETFNSEINTDVETGVNAAEKPIKYYGNNGAISPNNHPPFKSYAECTTPEEVERVREERRRGGINSGIVRRANGSIRAAMRRYLEECGDDSSVSRADAVGKRLINIAIAGEDKNAVKAADLITKVTGEQVQQVDLNANVRTVANWRERPPKAAEIGEISGDNAEPMP